MQVICTQCGRPIDAADVHLESRLAKCRACSAVFDFTAQVRGDDHARSASRRAPVPMPEGIRVVEDEPALLSEGGYRAAPTRGGRVVLERSWYSPTLFFLVFFCVAWDSFLFFWYSTALTVEGPPSLLMVIFPAAHVAVGVGLTYRTLAGFVNKTRVTVTPDELTVRHGPLPWRGNVSLPAAALTQLYCEETVTHGKNGTSRTYTLSAVLRDGRKIALIKALPEAAQALFLEQLIEERLGIRDAPVGGEYVG